MSFVLNKGGLSGLLFCFGVTLLAQSPNSPQLWYWHNTYLATPGAVQSAESVIDQAVAAGYTGVALWDSSLTFMSASWWPEQNVQDMQTVINYAVSKGLKVILTTAPFGYSNDALQNNPNWAESQRSVGAQFSVDPSGANLNFINSFSGLQNSNFEQGQVAWFDLNDQGVSLDTTTGHNDSVSAKISYPQGNARIRQHLTLTPWRQYHLQLWVKTQNLYGYPNVYIFDDANFSIMRLNAGLTIGANSDWTQIDYSFNSQATSAADIYLGIWGGAGGAIWFDDIQIEETDLVYVTRRDGTPVRVYDPANPSTVYTEGVDYNYISDPAITGSRTPYQNAYHDPAPVTLPPGTSLRPGQVVAIDSYEAYPVPGSNEMGICLSEPGVLDWLTENAKAVAAVLPAGGGYFMQYDEMRQMNSCGACKAKNLTAGQLLAWNVGQALQTYQGVSPGAPMYVWSDMFDPNHNAIANYYNVEGDLSGSWLGLPPAVTVMNWNLSHLSNSLKWFAGLNWLQPVAHPQIIAGYYDSGDGSVSARAELASASGIPGVVGLMYTTWNWDYSQMSSFASTAKKSWPAYLASLGPESNAFPGLYNLSTLSQGKCLEVSADSTKNGAVVQQWTCYNGINQRWQLIPAGGGYYELLNINSGLALNVAGGPPARRNGTFTEQRAYLNLTSEHWNLQPTSNGYYTITAQSSGKCLEVLGGDGVWLNGARVDTWTCVGARNQQWQLIPTN